jgi:hypothetical protein
VAVCGLLVGATPLLFPAQAAARPAAHKPGSASPTRSGGGIRAPYGNDISSPQCGQSFPGGATFGLVGVDDGIANQENRCLGPDGGGTGTSELYWGSRRAGGTGQPPVALYVNTADPGNTYKGQPIADWPRPRATVHHLANPYGQCRADPRRSSLGADSTACAWVYGADLASLDASSGAPLTGTSSRSFLSSASAALQARGASVPGRASAYRWWLDVEAANTWQPRSAARGKGLAMNAAVLEGMLQYLRSLGARTVGIYSTSSQWRTITGGQSAIRSSWNAAGKPSPSPLSGIPDWVPGASQQSDAISACSASSFTGGRRALTQWVQNSLDYDQAC